MKNSFKRRDWEGLTTPHWSKTVGNLHIILQHLQDISLAFSWWYVCENVGVFFLLNFCPLATQRLQWGFVLKWHIYMKRLGFVKLLYSIKNCSHWRKPLSALLLTFPVNISLLLWSLFSFSRDQAMHMFTKNPQDINFIEYDLNESK